MPSAWRTLLVLLLVALPLLLAGTTPAASGQSYRERPTRAQYKQGAVLVKFKPQTHEGAAQAAMAAAGAAEDARIEATDVRRILVPPGRELERIADLLANPLVEYAGPDYEVSIDWVPSDPRYSSQWGLPKISAPVAWDSAKGEGITVAVIDTGVDLSHPDLVANLVAGYDFVNGDSIAADDNGHGTHVAGIVAAADNNGTGGLGLAPRARIMPIKVLDRQGSGSYFAVEQGIQWAADHGAKVINMSLGGSVNSPDLQAAVDYAWSKGVVIVAAAGNANSSSPSYPGGSNHVMAVAATDNRDVRAWFSNYGSFVSVAAPGLSILSTTPTYPVRTGLDLNYAHMSGTSMATPFVAGLSALVLSAGNCPDITNLGVRQAIERGADNIDSQNPSYVDRLGHGRINAKQSFPAPKSLKVGPKDALFLAQSGDSKTQRRTISVDTGTCVAPWAASLENVDSQQSWIGLTISGPPTNTITIETDPTGLPTGTYNATVGVSYLTNGSATKQTLSVALEVVNQVFSSELFGVSKPH